MNRLILFPFYVLMAAPVFAEKPDYPITPVSLSRIELTDEFWLPKIKTIQQKTIQYAFRKCEEEGRMENFVTAGDIIRGKGAKDAKVRGKMVFDDTDLYKTIEGAAYTLVNAPDPKLDGYLDSVIALIAYGQEPDGYLTTWRTIDPENPPSRWVKSGGGRWFHLGMSHELYNAGHLYEAAAAHYRATGKRNFLDIALKNADLLVKTFMTSPVDNLHLEFPGHQIVETGLIQLYQITGNENYLSLVTGNENYLSLAKQFLDNRGRSNIQGNEAYRQDHRPVTAQDEAVGHAVRAVYMYAGMTDIAAICKDSAYRVAIDKIWRNVVDKKMYLTGGLGALHSGEAFGANYELPNLTAYAETCAAIGGVFWNERMFRLTGEAKYINVMERMLYNGVISGISQSGTEFFYCNPLESDGKYKFNSGELTRAAWFDCSCCPTNLIRFLPYVPNMIYATREDTVYVNLYMSNKADIRLKDQEITVLQKTDYPWSGKIEITVTPRESAYFTLKVRVPDWVQNQIADGKLYHYTNKRSESFSIRINGKAANGEIKNGYFEISGIWEKGDCVSLDFPMEVRRVEAIDAVKSDIGKFALECGPLVYCQEQPVNGSAEIPVFLKKSQVLKYQGMTLIPYFAWANRGVSQMRVWLDGQQIVK